MIRLPQWDTVLFDGYLRESVNLPFVWGSNDCCLSAANAIESFTGIDIASEFRGKYSDEASAFALIASITGGSTVADAAAYCADKFGLTEYGFPLMAKRGDLCVVKNGDTLIAGVVHLNGKHIISVSVKGLVRLPITSVVRSWSV